MACLLSKQGLPNLRRPRGCVLFTNCTSELNEDTSINDVKQQRLSLTRCRQHIKGRDDSDSDRQHHSSLKHYSLNTTRTITKDHTVKPIQNFNNALLHNHHYSGFRHHSFGQGTNFRVHHYRQPTNPRLLRSARGNLHLVRRLSRLCSSDHARSDLRHCLQHYCDNSWKRCHGDEVPDDVDSHRVRSCYLSDCDVHSYRVRSCHVPDRDVVYFLQGLVLLCLMRYWTR